VTTTPKKTRHTRHSWKHSKGGKSGTCKVCGLKYRLVKNGDALMLLTKYFVDGEWIALKSQPLCVKVKTTMGGAK